MSQPDRANQPHLPTQPAASAIQHSRPSSGRERIWSLSTWQMLMLGTAVVVLGLSLVTTLELIVRPLALLFGAIIIAEALSPIVDLMARKVPRVLAIIVPYVIVVGAIAGASWLLYPTMVTEAQRLVDRGPEIVNQAQDWIDSVDPTGDGRITSMVTDRLGQASGALANIPFTIVSSIVEVVLVIAMSIYWLIAKPSLRNFVLSLFPERRRNDADDVIREMGSTIGGYVRAELLTALVIAILTYVGLTIIGVEYAIILAVIAGLGELVPVLGPFISAIPAVAVALLDSPLQAAVVVGFFLVLQQIESNILLPNLMHQQANIPPLLSILSLFIGGSVGGILGALVAIPLAGALKVLVIHVLAPAIRNWSGANQSTNTSQMEEPQ